MMLSVPNTDETKARGVGIQIWRCEETADKNGVEGSQWAGRVADTRCCSNGGGMVVRVVSVCGSIVSCRSTPKEHATPEWLSGEKLRGGRESK
jgi:hypothetical protein